jgi:aspartate aminotransferase
MISTLQQVPAGDVVLLHACCHNPSGIDPTPKQWHEIAAVVHERGLLPLVDFAYQGFGAGLVEDAAGLRLLTQPGRELLVCSSFSKNFGLYGERVGALSQVRISIRTNYSNPPTHGAAIVAAVLGDSGLRQDWEQELAAMRARIHEMRRLFVATMRAKAPQHDFTFLETQQGMFSFSGLTNLQVDELRSQHGVYVVGNGGRINVAGMTRQNMDPLCSAIAAVL